MNTGYVFWFTHDSHFHLHDRFTGQEKRRADFTFCRLTSCKATVLSTHGFLQILKESALIEKRIMSYELRIKKLQQLAAHLNS